MFILLVVSDNNLGFGTISVLNKASGYSDGYVTHEKLALSGDFRPKVKLISWPKKNRLREPINFNGKGYFIDGKQVSEMGTLKKTIIELFIDSQRVIKALNKK